MISLILANATSSFTSRTSSTKNISLQVLKQGGHTISNISGICCWNLDISIKMSTKHYFPETAVNTLVPRALTSFVAANPELALITDQRVVLNTNHTTSQVALISGGGSGHEPAWYALLCLSFKTVTLTHCYQVRLWYVSRVLILYFPVIPEFQEMRPLPNISTSPKKALIFSLQNQISTNTTLTVGTGLLSAVACGDIFASPSMKQVLSAIASVPSSAGTILLITNYTGDKLHFGLAAERALASGLARKCVVLPATDDVSIPRSRCEKVGRRGLAGNVLSEYYFSCS